jgi:iron complex outermembrane receptor protein
MARSRRREIRKKGIAMRTTHARSATKRTRRGPAGIPHGSRSKLSFAITAALSGTMVIHVAPAATTDSSSTSLEEIVVTARKRTENLQDVPISIDVYTAKDIQKLAISQFEDYATMTPSISFISAGPGSQTLVMRGVSDGSNPNYANTAATLFLLDDMSMNYQGTLPDLHLYDIERIEVLNGPQGTTFGAGAMAGALRFITNKPDPTAFSAGVDLAGGKIDAGGHNGTAEGFVNLPIIADWTALRISAFSDYHGGFINNLLHTRNWVNGAVSDNSAWAGKNYNVEKVTGARIALGQKISDGWKATLTYSYQRQLTHGAWDEDPTIGGVDGPVTPLHPNTVVRFGPELRQNYTKTLDFHLDGDVGIGDLVYASTYWAQDNRQVNEYSEYMQYLNQFANPPSTVNATSKQAFTCLTDPINGAGFSGCKPPNLYYDYVNNTQRWSNELRLQSKEGGRFHWLGGLYWEKTINPYSDYFHMPGLQTAGQQWQAYTAYYNLVGAVPPKPDDWYSYQNRFDYLQTTEFANVTFDITPRLHIEAGTVHFHSNFSTYSGYGGFWYNPSPATVYGGSSSKWNSKLGISYKALDGLLVYANAAQGFRDGGVNGGLPANCAANGAPAKYQPDTLTNYEIGWKSTMLDNHLVWDGAFYYMPWKNYQTLLFDPSVCLSNSFNANIGDARIYGVESNVKYQVTAALVLEFSASYNDSHIISNTFENPNFQVTPGERLPYVPYLDYSGNARYEAPIRDSLHGFAQFDIAHKGDMWNSLQTSGSNGLPRVLQPGYSVMNVRLGLNEIASRWTTELFITNLTNKNAVIYTNEGNFDLRQTRNEPRVFGLRLSYRWGKESGGTGGE